MPATYAVIADEPDVHKTTKITWHLPSCLKNPKNKKKIIFISYIFTKYPHQSKENCTDIFQKNYKIYDILKKFLTVEN